MRVSPAQDKTGNTSVQAKPEAVLFDALPVVEAASLHTQTLMEAPASVTVITKDDIRRRGYRTLAEALSDVRGLYVANDRSFQSLGVRGFAIPGDYSTRFAVLINGHSLTENVFGTTGYFGQNFGLDMDLIERIEIIRGPSSALYGSNGMFATINIVTRSPVDYQTFRASVETDSFGERKTQVTTSQYLGRGANLLLSASVFNNAGQSLYFPSFDTPATNHGWATNVDAEKGYHTYANLIWRDWSFLAYFAGIDKIIPTGWHGAVFDDPGTSAGDRRGFVEAAYQRNVGMSGQLRWRVYYDEHSATNRVDLPGNSPVLGALALGKAYIFDGRQSGEGERFGTELTYRFQISRIGYLTVGSEATWDVLARLSAYVAAPMYRPISEVNDPGRSFAAFAQQEWEISPHWKAYLGGRLDISLYHDLALTPRVGLIYQPSANSALKLLYGRSFRNPSVFEQFYGDGVTQIGSSGLKPEQMQTIEAVFERKLGKRFELSADVYHYALDDLITAVPLTSVRRQYQNAAFSQSTGFELEATAQTARGLKADASLAVQGQVFERSAVAQVNSRARVGKLLIETPLWGNRFSASGALQYLSDRRTFTGASVPAVYLVNFSLANRPMLGGLEMQLGIRNLLNRRYWDPVGTGQVMDRVEQDGRCFFARISWGPPSEKKQDRAQLKASGAPGKDGP
jgi:outer membrane receptor for ferrienterochelin and colicins